MLAFGCCFDAARQALLVYLVGAALSSKACDGRRGGGSFWRRRSFGYRSRCRWGRRFSSRGGGFWNGCGGRRFSGSYFRLDRGRGPGTKSAACSTTQNAASNRAAQACLQVFAFGFRSSNRQPSLVAFKSGLGYFNGRFGCRTHACAARNSLA